MFQIQSFGRAISAVSRCVLAGVLVVMWVLPATGAQLTISNDTTGFDGYHGVADNSGVLLGGSGSGGFVGRMTISDSAVTALVMAGDMAGLDAAFVPFDAGSGAFDLGSLGQLGAFEVDRIQDTRASQNNGFGGSSIFVWLYKGTSRTAATEYLLMKLSATFATDPEIGPPLEPDEVYLRPSSGTLFAGSSGPQQHTYSFPGSLPATIFRMMGTGPVPVNQAPVASAGVLAAVAGAGKSGQLVASDLENSPLTYTKTSDPTKGSVVVQTDGSFVYTATAGQTGADSFKFKANDGNLDSNEATISITINAPPVASGASLAAVAGVGKAGQLVASDLENSPLTYTKTSDPIKGSVVVQTDGSFVYTATAGQTGADSFKFKANDGNLDSNEATISITINAPPVASGAALAAVAGVGKSGQLVASDTENSPLTYVKTSDPIKGSVVVQTDGSFVYTATVGQTGADSFKFKANDGNLDSNEATISITIAGAPGGLPPVGVPASFEVSQSDLLSGVLQGSDPEDSALTFAVGTEPVNGTLTMQSNGGFSYQPDHLFIGDDSFTFTVNDGLLSSTPVLVVVVVREQSPGWAWMNGEQATNLNGVYGTQGVGAAENRPGARSLSASGSKGKVMYVFGGLGRGEIGAQGLLNDLWRFDASTNQWAWVGGGKGLNAAGVYGSLGVTAAGNVPGGRSGAVLWVDDLGRVWMFGGFGRGSDGALTGELNDLWRFDPGVGQWAWVSGGTGVNANGVYGTMGTAAAGNFPGGRSGAVGWQDGAGRLWVFGGRGRGFSGATSGLLSDLWRFDAGLGQWTHCKGSTGINALGRYGSDTVEVIDQGPGGRSGASAWMGVDGMMYLFGGQGLAGSGAAGFLNDLWAFNPDSGEWRGGVYRAGSSRWATSPGLERTNVVGVNGVLGVSAATNFPSARAGAVASLAPDGKLMLFGGAGSGAFNDVWLFDPVLSNWTWLKGHSRTNQLGVYGQKGVAAASNTPGARGGSVGFMEPSGHFWIFGGAAGTKAFSDGWRLRGRILPTVAWESLVATGETSADVGGKVSVNVGAGETSVSVEHRAVGSSGAWTVMNRPALAPAVGEVPVSASLTGLLAGTAYEVQIRVSNSAGSAVTQTKSVTTLGTAVGPLLASFVSGSSSVVESRGAARVEVQLSAPAPSGFSIPMTFVDSTASVGSDYSTAGTNVAFLAGQTRAWSIVSVVNDGVPESDEVVRLTLGTPTLGAVTVGAPSSHDLLVQDDDGPATVISVLAGLGGGATLSVSVNASGTKRYQWKKSGKKITGATGASLSFAAVKLTDAGAYSVDVTLASGLIVTGTAQLAVVDTAARRVLGLAGAPVSLPVSSAGSGLTFEWRKVGNATVLGAGNPLSLATLDGGDYECAVSMAGVGQMICPVTLNLVTSKPVMTQTRLPDGYVGASYSFVMGASNLPEGEAQAFTVLGLPKGMVASADGRISGVPTAPVVDKAITIVASNPRGTTQRVILLTIKTLPPALVGTYGGWFGKVDGMPGGGVGGRVDVSVTSSGSYSASLISGTDSRTARGPVSVSLDGASLRIVATFVRSGSPSIVADLIVVGAPTVGQLEVSGPILVSGTGLSGTVEGVKLASVEPARVETYTYGLLLDEAHDGVLAVPQGDGFGTCKLLATGRATLVGRAADGSAYTAAAVMGREGDLPVFLSVASVGTAGGIAGMAEVRLAALNNGMEGELAWTRAVASSVSKTRSYRAGFGPVALNVVGGIYQGPAAGGIIAGLPNKSGNVKVSFENRALIEGNVADLVFTIASAGGVKQKVTVPVFNAVPPVNPNPAKISFVLDAKVAGAFNGSFTLPGATTALDRKAGYQGIFVRLPSGSFFAAGYYLIAQPPQPGVVMGSVPELSGRVLVAPVP
jgi:N-acetylneuraminic acid mutarotase